MAVTMRLKAAKTPYAFRKEFRLKKKQSLIIFIFSLFASITFSQIFPKHIFADLDRFSNFNL
jgi:hypothetical protein